MTGEKRNQSDLMGMWVFLVTEFFFFLSLFVAFSLYYSLYTESFHEASRHLSVALGSVNTLILLTSSFFMATALWCAQKDRRRGLVICLLISLGLALSFLGVKAVEYSREINEGLFPNQSFRFAPEFAAQAKLFFYLYFVMTGFHALHILAGMGAMVWVLRKAWLGRYDSQHSMGVELVALYWHFVDIVWIFIFPLLYLLGAHS